VEITLPDPCPVCLGPVTFGGRGRRPDFCGRACVNVQRAEDMRNRRARERGDVAPLDPLIAALAERRRQAIAAQPRVAVHRAHDEHMIEAAEVAAEAAGEGRATEPGAWLPESERGAWCDRTALPRAADRPRSGSPSITRKSWPASRPRASRADRPPRKPPIPAAPLMSRRTAGRASAVSETVTPRLRGEDLPRSRPVPT